MTVYISGLLLGLALIVPIGPQNIVVLNQGLTVGLPRSLFAVLFAGLCDSLLIVIGAVGLGALLTEIPALRSLLLAVGVLFLLFLAWKTLSRSTANVVINRDGGPLRDVAVRIIGVSLLNPHAILDMVVIIGAAIAAQSAELRLVFAGGTLTASWLWFLFLVVAASAVRRFLSPRSMAWIDRVSAGVLVFFAGVLAIEFARSI